MNSDKKINKSLTSPSAIGLMSVAVFLTIWQIVSARKIIDPIFIGTPTLILKAGIKLFTSGEIYPYLKLSSEALFISLFLSIIFGVIAGLIIGSNKKLEQIILPFIFASNSLPVVVLIPLIIIWLGLGTNAKVVVIFLMAVIPILVNTMDAAKSIDSSVTKMAQSFKASKLFILKNIVFFHSLPFILSGIRVAAGRAIIALFVAELFGLGEGIGYLISYYGATFQTNKLMAVALLILLLNFLIVNVIINFTEKRIVKWKV